MEKYTLVNTNIKLLQAYCVLKMKKKMKMVVVLGPFQAYLKKVFLLNQCFSHKSNDVFILVKRSSMII